MSTKYKSMVSSLFVNNLLVSLGFMEFIRDQHRITQTILLIIIIHEEAKTYENWGKN